PLPLTLPLTLSRDTKTYVSDTDGRVCRARGTLGRSHPADVNAPVTTSSVNYDYLLSIVCPPRQSNLTAAVKRWTSQRRTKRRVWPVLYSPIKGPFHGVHANRGAGCLDSKQTGVVKRSQKVVKPSILRRI
ncbi:hypothetical protein LSAT2_009966, partial [Lamellibrachia satsuma]